MGLNLVGSVASFYGTIWMLKIMLEYLFPMVMMTVYIFWGVFMIMGEMRGGALVKGLFLLFGLTIIPRIWSIIDHLDDNLFAAMYDSVLANPFNRVLLDAATGVFYFLAPFVVFNMLGMVGFGDASGSMQSSHRESQNLSGSLGRGLGRGGGSLGRWMMIGRTSTKGVDANNKPVSTFSGGYRRGVFGGLRNRWNNFRNKPQ